MSTHPPGNEEREVYLPRSEFARLLDVLATAGYQVIGPTVDQGTIVYGPVNSIADLPIGWTDQQAPGQYRLERRQDERMFGYVVGPHSWKTYLFPPHLKLTQADRNDAGWTFSSIEEQPPKYAFLGVRACELAAMRVQDRVFLGGPYVDANYDARRTNALVIAVNCTQAATTCFCDSMRTGPRCNSGFDLALTELDEGFLVEIATAEGRAIVKQLQGATATIDHRRAASDARQEALDQIQRSLDTQDIRDLLMSNLNHPHWDDVAARCLSCTNCTMVCPTCFCSSVEEVSDLSGDHVERHRRWDSCFNVDFSYTNGGAVRDQIRSRYRQWLTHKLASWIDQFGSSGCVGCGRCITWCPVGIDLTAEVAVLRGTSA